MFNVFYQLFDGLDLAERAVWIVFSAVLIVYGLKKNKLWKQILIYVVAMFIFVFAQGNEETQKVLLKRSSIDYVNVFV